MKNIQFPVTLLTSKGCESTFKVKNNKEKQELNNVDAYCIHTIISGLVSSTKRLSTFCFVGQTN